MNQPSQTFKESGLEWLCRVPIPWTVRRIKDIAELRSGDAIAAEEIAPAGDYPVFGGNGVRGFTTSFTHDGHYVLIGRQGALCGNINYARGRFWATEHAVVATLLHNHDTIWFGELLRTMNLNQYSNAAAQPGLAVDRIKFLRLPVPTFPEQQRIAAYLDASCAAIDAAVAAKRAQIETLDGVRKDIIQKAVTRGLEGYPTLKKTGNVWMNEVPFTWELVSLKRVSEIQGGLTLGKVYEGPLIERPYLRVANVQDGHLNLQDVTTIEVPEEVAYRVELRPGDVLMTEGGDLDKLGRGTIWNGEIPDCLHQNHIFAIRCFKHKLLSAFLAYLTTSRYGRDYFEATGKRTTNLASTNSTKVGLFPIPRPAIAEQRAICRFLDEKLNHVAQIVNGIEAQIETLTAYRKSLIHECVTGQRRIAERDTSNLMLT
jgi:type I restriction enzyme S subunit